jgi:hypothetical protein
MNFLLLDKQLLINCRVARQGRAANFRDPKSPGADIG